jgi:hypothetical protein
MASFPPRLHVLLARESDLALVLRRGPSKSVCSILWHRRDDSFEVGQWLRGRIYERRADLSPDGRHLIYFAMNGRWTSPTGGSWTAISRAPWLRALVLLGKGDCWHGGGLFSTNRTYWVNDGYGHHSMRASSEVVRDESLGRATRFGGECPGVYYPRLIRDGWTLVDRIEASARDSCTVFEKPAGAGWILRKLAHEQVGAPRGKGCYWDEHELEHPGKRRRHAFPDWEWADVDRRGLVWAEHGTLSRARVAARGLADARVIHDFNGMKFQAIAAPYD